MIVQDDSGTVANADSYTTVAAFRTYWLERGSDMTSTADALIEAALVKATDFLDQRFGYRGRKLFGREQTTQWPRVNCYDRDRLYVNGVPNEVKHATCEYAKRALVAPLAPDPTYDATGGKLIEKTEKVDVIETTVKFSEGVPISQPKYPSADGLLKRAGLVESGGEIRRG